MSLNVHEAITSDAEPASIDVSREPAVESYRDPGADTEAAVIEGILREDRDDTGRSITAGLKSSAVPAEEFEPSEFEVVAPDGSKRDLADVLSFGADAQRRASAAEGQLHEHRTAAAESSLEEALALGNLDDIGVAAIELRRTNPEAFVRLMDEHRQSELDERSEGLDFFGSDSEFFDHYSETMGDPTWADYIEQAVEVVEADAEHQRRSHEHAQLSAELETKQYALKKSIMEAELGTTEPERIEAGYSRLVGLQVSLAADPVFANDVLQGDDALVAKLTRPLDALKPDDPAFAETVRGLKAVWNGLNQTRQQEHFVRSWFAEPSTTISEALDPPGPEVEYTVDPAHVKQAMKTKPKGQGRNADRLRSDLAATSVGQQMRREPAFVALAKQEREEREMREKRQRARNRSGF